MLAGWHNDWVDVFIYPVYRVIACLPFFPSFCTIIKLVEVQFIVIDKICVACCLVCNIHLLEKAIKYNKIKQTAGIL